MSPSGSRAADLSACLSLKVTCLTHWHPTESRTLFLTDPPNETTTESELKVGRRHVTAQYTRLRSALLEHNGPIIRANLLSSRLLLAFTFYAPPAWSVCCLHGRLGNPNTSCLRVTGAFWKLSHSAKSENGQGLYTAKSGNKEFDLNVVYFLCLFIFSK